VRKKSRSWLEGGWRKRRGSTSRGKKKEARKIPAAEDLRAPASSEKRGGGRLPFRLVTNIWSAREERAQWCAEKKKEKGWLLASAEP